LSTKVGKRGIVPSRKSADGCNKTAGTVAVDEEYEVGYLPSKFGLSIPDVRQLIAKDGNDPDTLEREAKALGTR
jgi:hypothetical protein